MNNHQLLDMVCKLQDHFRREILKDEGQDMFYAEFTLAPQYQYGAPAVYPIHHAYSLHAKVSLIKMARLFGNLGLKEAKDLIETLMVLQEGENCRLSTRNLYTAEQINNLNYAFCPWGIQVTRVPV